MTDKKEVHEEREVKDVKATSLPAPQQAGLAEGIHVVFSFGGRMESMGGVLLPQMVEDPLRAQEGLAQLAGRLVTVFLARAYVAMREDNLAFSFAQAGAESQ